MNPRHYNQRRWRTARERSARTRPTYGVTLAQFISNLQRFREWAAGPGATSMARFAASMAFASAAVNKVAQTQREVSATRRMAIANGRSADSAIAAARHLSLVTFDDFDTCLRLVRYRLHRGAPLIADDEPKPSELLRDATT